MMVNLSRHEADCILEWSKNNQEAEEMMVRDGVEPEFYGAKARAWKSIRKKLRAAIRGKDVRR